MLFSAISKIAVASFVQEVSPGIRGGCVSKIVSIAKTKKNVVDWLHSEITIEDMPVWDSVRLGVLWPSSGQYAATSGKRGSSVSTLASRFLISL